MAKDDKGRRYLYAPIQIGDDVFIGMNTLLLPGVTIGNKCIVGAGSVVTKSIPSGKVVAGVPAKIIGTTEDYLKKCLKAYVTAQNFPTGKPDRVHIINSLSPPKPFLQE